MVVLVIGDGEERFPRLFAIRMEGSVMLVFLIAVCCSGGGARRRRGWGAVVVEGSPSQCSNVLCG